MLSQDFRNFLVSCNVFHSGAIFAAVVRLEGTGAVIAFDAFTLVFLGTRAYLIPLTTATLLPWVSSPFVPYKQVNTD